MSASQQVNTRSTLIILALCWSLILLIAMGLKMYDTNRNILTMARLEAGSAVTKDVLYRSWNTVHDGLYGFVSEQTKPNPLLKVPHRDIPTPDGRLLTLINPDVMTRQVHELERQQEYGLRSHMTSLNPIVPANSPDPWERQALHQFTQGATEVSTLETLDGQPYFRLMRPLVITKRCLKCHGAQGYEEGDIGGGISASVPMDQWNILKRQTLLQEYLLYLAFWLFGLLGLSGAMYQLHSQIKRNQKISEELEQVKSTLDRINDCVFMVDPQTLQFIYTNRAVHTNSGYSGEELQQMSLDKLFTDLNRNHFEELVEILTTGHKEYFQFEGAFQRRDRTIIPVDVQLQFIEPAAGHGRVVAVLRNISKRKEMEREKQQMETRLLQAQKLESVGQLAAGIAHEINTPTQYVATNITFLEEGFQDTAAIIAQCQKLLTAEQGGSVSAEHLTALRQIIDEVDWEYLAEEIPAAIKQSKDGIQRVNSIVRAMKEFSHPGSKEKTPLDLNHLIETTVTVARNEWKYVAELETSLAEDLPPVPCLADEMGQVFLNLLVNAAQAIGEKLDNTPEGNKGTITLTTRSVNNMAEIRVQDSGSGIPKDRQQKIFDPFFTTKEVGKGTGQGLAIARDVVVHKHGGTVDVESTEGKGTTFIIRLPLTPEG